MSTSQQIFLVNYAESENKKTKLTSAKMFRNRRNKTGLEYSENLKPEHYTLLYTTTLLSVIYNK